MHKAAFTKYTDIYFVQCAYGSVSLGLYTVEPRLSDHYRSYTISLDNWRIRINEGMFAIHLYCVLISLGIWEKFG